MAGYKKGNKEWLKFVKERILFIGDLLISPLTTAEEKKELLREQTTLVLHLCNYYENLLSDDQ